MLLCQPLHWRGGILQGAWKGAGTKADVANYRSLFISSLPGKSFHRLLRERAGAVMKEALHDFQLRARKQAPVLLPALYIQAFLRGGRDAGRSAAVVFLDSQSAYYRVIRELAVGEIEIESDRAVTYIFKTFGLQAEDMGGLQADDQGWWHDGGCWYATTSTTPGEGYDAPCLVRNQTWHPQPCQPFQGWVPSRLQLGGCGLRLCPQQAFDLAASAEGLLTAFSVNADQGPLGGPAGGEEVEARDSVWAADASLRGKAQAMPYGCAYY